MGAGDQVENADESLHLIAAKNRLSPQQVYEIIKAAKITEAFSPAGVTAVTASRWRKRAPGYLSSDPNYCWWGIVIGGIGR